VLASLVHLARAPIELAEPEVAVGDEGTHLEFGGERQRLSMAALRARASAVPAKFNAEM